MIRRRIIGGLLLTGIGAMVLARDSKRPVKPKDGTGSEESQDDASPTLRRESEMTMPDPDQPANGAHPRSVPDLWAGSDGSDGSDTGPAVAPARPSEALAILATHAIRKPPGLRPSVSPEWKRAPGEGALAGSTPRSQEREKPLRHPRAGPRPNRVRRKLAPRDPMPPAPRPARSGRTALSGRRGRSRFGRGWRCPEAARS